MIYLILAILSSTLVSVLMRLGSGGEARKPLLAVNYLACIAVSLFFLEGGADAPAAWGVAIGMGALGGFLYLGAFMLFQRCVRDSGLGLSSAFMKLGVVVPTLLGVTLFGESLGLPRAAGIALTILAIWLLSGDASGKAGGKLPALVALMLCGGMADGLSKFYEAYGSPALKGHFLLTVFGVALILCAGLCAVQRQKPTARDWVFGALLGIPNYFSSRFLLLALATVPASAAYPAFSCGTILLASAAGRLVFGERPGHRQLAAVAVVLAALLLLNL